MRVVGVGVSSSRSECAPQHANRAYCVPGRRISSVFPNTGAADGLYLMSRRFRVLERPLTGEPSRLLSSMYKCHAAKGLYAPVLSVALSQPVPSQSSYSNPRLIGSDIIFLFISNVFNPDESTATMLLIRLISV